MLFKRKTSTFLKAEVFPTSDSLANQVWEQSHEAGALDRERELALVPATDAGTLARHDLSKGGKVAAQGVGILVVDLGGIDLTEVAGAHFQLGILIVHHRDVGTTDRNSRSACGMK